MSDAGREQFEQWGRNNLPNLIREDNLTSEDYSNPVTRLVWAAWQASAKLNYDAGARDALQEPSVDLLTAITSLDRIHKLATERWRRGPVDRDSLSANLDDIVTISGNTIANFAQNTVERAREQESGT